MTTLQQKRLADVSSLFKFAYIEENYEGGVMENTTV
jgi:hypothetical protein